MPDGRSHVLEATDALAVEIGGYRERLPFDVCDLNRGDVSIGMHWREDKGARIDYKTIRSPSSTSISPLLSRPS